MEGIARPPRQIVDDGGQGEEMLDNIESHGLGTVGEKGQVVIPAKLRNKLDIKPGDELIFFGKGPMVHMIKAQELDQFLSRITQKFTQNISKIKKKIKNKGVN